MKRVALCLCLTASTSLLSAQQPAPTAKPGQATGERIGNVVSAAVNTAFPAVSKIIETIWPTDKNKKQNADEAKAALEAARKQALAKQEPLFKEIENIGVDLATTRTFLSHCTAAEVGVVTMRTLLGDGSKAALTSAEANQLSDNWNEVKARIQKLGSADVASKIDGMSDPFVQTTLRKVAEVNLGRVETIDKQVSGKRYGDLRRSLDALEPSLSAVGALSGELIGNFSAALTGLPDKIKAAQSVPDKKALAEAREASRVFRARLAAAYNLKF